MITTKLHPAFKAPIDNNVDGVEIDQNRLLADLAESNHPLVSIARGHKLRLDQLIAWITQPAIQALLDFADAVADRIAAHKAAQSRPSCIETLTHHTIGLCANAKDHELASRAARTIIQVSNPPKSKSRSKPPKDASRDSKPPVETPIRPPQLPEPIDPIDPTDASPSTTTPPPLAPSQPTAPHPPALQQND